MDPNATLKLINDAASIHDEECIEHAENLAAWIGRGGFEPDWAKYPEATRRYRKILGIKVAK